jgi:NAD(P)H-hydrate epimerase
VLTGVIAALMAQGLSNFDAAVLGVYTHGLAGDIAAKKTGPVSLIATDIIQALGDAFMKT